MIHTSRIELSRSAAASNVRFIRERIGERAALYSVLKGNAYGHGIEQMTALLRHAGVQRFATYDAAEALRVREAGGEQSEVMIMGFIDDQELQWAVEHGIQFYTFDLTRLESAIAHAKRIGRRAKIHIEVETGFNRTGFRSDELERALELVSANREHLEVEGLCTHLAGAESSGNHERVTRQLKRFEQIRSRVASAGVEPRFHHVACSAVVMNFPGSIHDMVRVGILNYGFWPSPETEARYLAHGPVECNPLRRVIAWKSRVMSINDVPAGEYVGYGSTFLTERDTRIAVVPVGYGYGFTRALSNRGRVLIRGKRLSVIGLVNMNMITVDATELEDLKIGEEVVLIGSQGDQSIPVSSFSEMSEQLNYELLTRLPHSIPRTIVE